MKATKSKKWLLALLHLSKNANEYGRETRLLVASYQLSTNSHACRIEIRLYLLVEVVLRSDSSANEDLLYTVLMLPVSSFRKNCSGKKTENVNDVTESSIIVHIRRKFTSISTRQRQRTAARDARDNTSDTSNVAHKCSPTEARSYRRFVNGDKEGEG